MCTYFIKEDANECWLELLKVLQKLPPLEGQNPEKLKQVEENEFCFELI